MSAYEASASERSMPAPELPQNDGNNHRYDSHEPNVEKVGNRPGGYALKHTHRVRAHEYAKGDDGTKDDRYEHCRSTDILGRLGQRVILGADEVDNDLDCSIEYFGEDDHADGEK